MELNHNYGISMKKVFQILTIILYIWAGRLTAQDSENILSLEKALELGKKNNLTLQQQLDRINQARSQLKVQKTGYFPKLTAGGFFNYLSEIPELNLPLGPAGSEPATVKIYDLNISLQQPIFTGFRTRNMIKSAQEDLNNNESVLLAVRQQISYQICYLYYLAQLTRLQKEALQTSLNRSLNNLRLSKNLLLAGQARAIDTLNVANQCFKIETELNKISYSYELILIQLEEVINHSPIDGIASYSELDITLELEPLQTYLTRALENRPELSQIQYQIKAQQYRKKSIQSGYYPQLYGQASFHYLYPDAQIFKQKWTDLYFIGLNLQWEPWNWGRRKHEVHQISYAINQLGTEQEKQIQSIRNQVKQAYKNLQSDKDQILLTGKLLQQENERYTIIQNQYQQGLATTIDLNDAESALTSAQLQLLQAQIKWLQDRALLAYVTGKIETIYQE
jgi:outer membrane protein TolC